MISLQPWASDSDWICTVKTQKKGNFQASVSHFSLNICHNLHILQVCSQQLWTFLSCFSPLCPCCSAFHPPNIIATFPLRRHRTYSMDTNTTNVLGKNHSSHLLFSQKSCKTYLPPKPTPTAIISAWLILSFISDPPYRNLQITEVKKF